MTVSGFSLDTARLFDLFFQSNLRGHVVCDRGTPHVHARRPRVGEHVTSRASKASVIRTCCRIHPSTPGLRVRGSLIDR